MSETDIIALITDTIAAINEAIPGEYWATGGTAPPAYKAFRQRLPIARDVLEKIKGEVELKGSDRLPADIKFTLQSCKQKSQRLEAILRETYRAMTQSPSHLFAISNWYNAEVASLGQGIMNDINSLDENQDETDKKLLDYLKSPNATNGSNSGQGESHAPGSVP